jgi:hypothetical protein
MTWVICNGALSFDVFSAKEYGGILGALARVNLPPYGV